jgi:hypothetical protein
MLKRGRLSGQVWRSRIESAKQPQVISHTPIHKQEVFNEEKSFGHQSAADNITTVSVDNRIFVSHELP